MLKFIILSALTVNTIFFSQANALELLLYPSATIGWGVYYMQRASVSISGSTEKKNLKSVAHQTLTEISEYELTGEMEVNLKQMVKNIQGTDANVSEQDAINLLAIVSHDILAD